MNQDSSLNVDSIKAPSLSTIENVSRLLYVRVKSDLFTFT